MRPYAEYNNIQFDGGRDEYLYCCVSCLRINKTVIHIWTLLIFTKSVPEPHSAAFKYCSQCHVIYQNKLYIICRTYQSQGKSKKDIEIHQLTVYSASVYFLPQNDLFAYNKSDQEASQD